jgi:acyl-coenzyme A thioesterase PaaI-like protein
MIDFAKITEKAGRSRFYLWLLNRGLRRMIPFNKPHGFRIVEIGKYKVRIMLPYRNVNLNHIRGLHACALATVSEYATGFVILSNLDPRKYRLILQRLEVDYYYQAKTDAYADYEISEAWLREVVVEPLQSLDAVMVPARVKVMDVKGNHLTSAVVTWQIKSWDKVRLKV